MYTSYFGNLKNLPRDLKTVGIAVGPPKWYGGASDKRLAPSFAMLKMSPDDYDYHFRQILAKLDPRDIAKSLGENAVMLCWEKPGDRCHRRAVAEWLENALSIEIPEWGIARSATMAYALTPRAKKESPAEKKERDLSKPKKGRADTQLYLF